MRNINFTEIEMQNIIVKNHSDVQAVRHEQDGNVFYVKPVISAAEVDKCYADFVEVEPGNTAYGYHWHEANEEIFYIISGEAAVKTLDGEIFLKQGDAICFPANEKGSHVIRNASETEKLVYLDCGTANRPDIVHFAGTESGMAVSRSGKLHMFDK